MNTLERDPRKNPAVGDVIVKQVGKRTVRRTVTYVRGGDIDYRQDGAGIKSCWITTWREWASTATVEDPAASSTLEVERQLLVDALTASVGDRMPLKDEEAVRRLRHALAHLLAGGAVIVKKVAAS